MTIQDFKEKINHFVADDASFYACLILVVAIASFGFGRASITPAETENASGNILLRESSTNTSASNSLDTTGITQDARKYVASRNSTKYHLPWCSGAKRIAEENKVWFSSKEQAQKSGYTPAANCPGI